MVFDPTPLWDALPFPVGCTVQPSRQAQLLTVLCSTEQGWTGSDNLFLLRSSRNSLKPQNEAILTKASDPKPPDSLAPCSGSERNSSSKGNISLAAPAAAPTAAVQASKATAQSKGLASKEKVVKEEKPEESDSDQEGPIATQMLSFVMDDPDFESEDSDSQKKKMVNNKPMLL